MKKITLLGTGLIGTFYTMSLHAQRRKDVIHKVCSGNEIHVRKFAGKWNIPSYTTSILAEVL